MSVKKIFVSTLSGAVVLGSVGLSTVLVSNASAEPGRGGHHHVMTGPTGNKVEMVDPGKSKYVPKIGRASAKDRAKARRLLHGVNRFCRNHSAAGLKSRWQHGTSSPKPTHYFNPKAEKSRGLHPSRPRAALIYEGRLDGVMFTGVPLGSLGSIPRAHSHNMSKPIEMVHVYCTRSLKEAFTPNRALGVKADLIALRLRIRPAVMDLNERQLRAVRAKVRHYLGDKLHPVSPHGSSGDGGPDPVLEAMRTEIRKSLMLLRERQLRSVWSLMQSH